MCDIDELCGAAYPSTIKDSDFFGWLGLVFEFVVGQDRILSSGCQAETGRQSLSSPLSILILHLKTALHSSSIAVGPLQRHLPTSPPRICPEGR